MKKSEIQDTNILKILNYFNVELELPNKVIDELKKLPKEISKEDIKNRVDLRDKTIFTIDGEDTKDIDDAISLSKLDNGNFYLGVHIADVTHYVPESSCINRMALNQGTSIYPVNNVVPMLPKELSNGICSLHPNVDRLTLSCNMEIDYSGNVVDYTIYKSVINSSYKLSYAIVSEILEKQNEYLINKYNDIYDTLLLFEKLTQILIRKREKRGSLDLDCPETKFECDKKGTIYKVKPYAKNIATSLIEECMIICNETVAEHCFNKKIPFIYRIHDKPNVDKMKGFRDFLYLLDMNVKENLTSKDLQKILSKIKGKPEEKALNYLLLRSLPKAVYNSEVSSHFGLASKCYCHFTSPIRRYPDLFIHRMIKLDLDNKLDEKAISKYKKIVNEIDTHCSTQEQWSQKIERESVKLKAAEFFSSRIGARFSGIVNGISENGLYVQIPNSLEGFISTFSIKDDKYTFDNFRLCFIGEERRKVYSLGTSLEIEVKRVNMETYQVDFIIIE